jgi:AraC-like DNA-binding protein
MVENTLIWESHCHAGLELIAVLCGSICVTLEGRETRLDRGDAIVIPPLCYHSISALKQGSYERLTVLFEESAIPEVLRDAIADGTPRPRRISSHLCAELERVCTSQQKEFYSPLADSLMIEALYALSGKAERDGGEDIDGTLASILEYVDGHLDSRILLDGIAARVSRSKSSVCHLFEERMSISPKQYILQKKMALAAGLIRKGVPPTEAALRVGYGNYSNFYRIYKKTYGHSPNEDIRRG